MELWIRSQDKGMLIKANEIYIDRNFDEIVKKYAYDIRINDIIVGNYETEKRALEILNEIQEILIDYSKMSRVVYQMPEE